MVTEMFSGGPTVYATRAEVRQIDVAAVAECGINSLVLMENAARALVDGVLDTDCERVLILCGPGNNGGDGFAAARIMASAGADCEVRLIGGGKELSSDAAANLAILRNAGGQVDEPEIDAVIDELSTLTDRDLIVDCLLGTGIRGAIRDPWATVVAAANQSSARILAADLPSGMDCDQGTAEGVCIEAWRTVTFAAAKQGFRTPESRRFTGDLTVAHIGMPATWVTEKLKQFRKT